jgi:hypothetical protein
MSIKSVKKNYFIKGVLPEVGFKPDSENPTSFRALLVGSIKMSKEDFESPNANEILYNKLATALDLMTAKLNEMYDELNKEDEKPASSLIITV